MIVCRFTEKVNRLFYIFSAFSLFTNVPEPGEAHTTESTHAHLLRKPARERYRPHNSPRCFRIVAEEVLCGMCA